MAMRLGVIFDLDDTLYPESEYVLSGFAHAAGVIETLAPGLGRQALCSEMHEMHKRGVRGSIFDRLLRAHPELEGKVSAADLVDAYRGHIPKIEFFPGASELLRKLSYDGFKIGILSDGPQTSQKNKVAALGLEGLCSPIVLTDAWGGEFWKPHPRGYEHIARAWNLPPGCLVYVGDNPEKDFFAPKRLGWQTVRLRLEDQLRYSLEPSDESFSAAQEADSFENLGKILSGLEQGVAA